MSSLPRVLLLDLDDTIVRYGAGGEGLWEEVLDSLAARLPVTAARLLAAIDAVREPFWADPERSRVARQDMFAARRAIVGQAFERIRLSPESELVRVVADAYSSEREARVAPFPGALETLAELRRRGHALGLLTNGGAPLQRAKRAQKKAGKQAEAQAQQAAQTQDAQKKDTFKKAWGACLEGRSYRVK